MSSDMTYKMLSQKPEDTSALGQRLGEILDGGEVIELIGDLGAGKTQFVRGLARGIGSDDDVQSPSFTISREYRGNGKDIHHYDLYRLGEEPGIIKAELAESIEDPKVIVVTEWAQAVEDVLPENKIKIELNYQQDELHRQIIVTADAKIIEALK